MRQSTVILSLLPLVLLSSCASKYQAPTSGPVANVTYVADIGVSSAFVFILGEDCRSTQAVGLIGQSTPPFILSGNPPVKEKTVVVPAKTPLLTQIKRDPATGLVNIYCLITTEFLPQPGASYRVLWSHDNQSCRTQVTRLDPTTGGWVREESAKRSDRRCSV